MYIDSVTGLQSASPVTPSYPKANPIKDYWITNTINYSKSNNYLPTIFRIIEELNTFEEYKELWLQDTSLHSSLTEKCEHHAYKKIINMGEDIIPFILYDLMKNNNYWFKALKEISHEDIISKDIQGNFQLIKNEWISWGRKKGYIK